MKLYIYIYNKEGERDRFYTVKTRFLSGNYLEKGCQKSNREE